MTRLFLYSLGIWFLLVVLAIVNGTARNALITPKVGEYAGHIISTVVVHSAVGGRLFIEKMSLQFAGYKRVIFM